MTDTIDLLALVLIVRPTQEATLPRHMGVAFYSQVLRWIGEVNPDLAQSLHDTDGAKPITCSGLHGARHLRDNAQFVTPERTYTLRITGLSAPVCQALLALHAQPPTTLELDHLPFTIEQITNDPQQHEWAGKTSYALLASPYLVAQKMPYGNFTLQFNAPTAFHSQGMTQPFPLPTFVFGSLIQRWNGFSTIALSPDVRTFCESQVALRHFRLRTQTVVLRNEMKELGFIGQAAYTILSRDRYWRSALNILAQFAFYGGIGIKTALGMGQTRFYVRQPNPASLPKQDD